MNHVDLSLDNALDRYAVVGFPVSHSRSPFIHGMFARQTGQQLHYQLLELAPNRLAAGVREFFEQGGKGLNITVPHKQSIAALVSYLTPRAELAGAVNTVSIADDGKLMGDNTDGVGLVNDLTKNLKLDLHRKRILMLGAGGAARGVIVPLLQEQPDTLVIANRNIERAQQLTQEFKVLGDVQCTSFDSVPAHPFDIIINATSASLAGELPPLDAALVGKHTVCYDMAYGNKDTMFTAWAKAHHAAQAMQGWGMLVEQAAESFFIWCKVRPETGPVLHALLNAPKERNPL